MITELLAEVIALQYYANMMDSLNKKHPLIKQFAKNKIMKQPFFGNCHK
jgi:hypothetical protein